MRSQHLLALPVVCALLVGCSSSPSSVPPLDPTRGDANQTDCPTGDTTLVYVVSSANELLNFDPSTATFKLVGNLTCPDSASNPYSMAIDRKGVAYVEYGDGNLFEVSTLDASCKATSYAPAQASFTLFGMGFATLGAGPAEQLFLGSADGILGMLDTSNFSVSTVGPFAPQLARPELTGTGDGHLYAFVATPNTGGSAVAEIDKANGNVIGQDALPQVEQGAGWAFAFWGGDFWLFTTPGAQQTWRYDPSAKTATVVASYSAPIVGAGVSTCAPQ